MASQSKSSLRTSAHKDRLTVWLMLSPTIFLFLVVSVYPFVWISKYIFYDYNGFVEYFIGLDNLKRLFADKLFGVSILHTLEYAFLKLITIIPLALVVAVLLNQKLRGKNFFRTVFFIPTVISAAVASLVFYFVYSPYNGILNGTLKALHITDMKIDLLGNPGLVMLSIIFVAIWGGLGNYMVLFLAGLQSIPDSIYESSKIDGTNKLQDFFYITIPMLQPMLKVILMLAITTALKDYQSIMVLTGGGPAGRSQVMCLYVYQLMFGNENGDGAVQIGYGSTVGLASSVIIAIITLIYLRVSKKMDDAY